MCVPDGEANPQRDKARRESPATCGGDDTTATATSRFTSARAVEGCRLAQGQHGSDQMYSRTRGDMGEGGVARGPDGCGGEVRHPRQGCTPYGAGRKACRDGVHRRWGSETTEGGVGKRTADRDRDSGDASEGWSNPWLHDQRGVRGGNGGEDQTLGHDLEGDRRRHAAHDGYAVGGRKQATGMGEDPWKPRSAKRWAVLGVREGSRRKRAVPKTIERNVSEESREMRRHQPTTASNAILHPIQRWRWIRPKSSAEAPNRLCTASRRTLIASSESGSG